MEKIFRTIKHEVLELIPPTIFFFFSFCLLILTQNLISRQYGIPLTSFVNAVIGALIVGKVVLIVDHFSFVNKFPQKPLLYNVVWKTLIYVLGALAVRYVEHLIEFARKYGGIVDGNIHLWNEMVWPRFWLIQMWLSVLFFIYCAFRELVRVLGREKVIRIFIGSPSK
ncbi:MAG: hypothetical protein ACLPX5_06540 [Dissulfurispiraceae bacterium]